MNTAEVTEVLRDEVRTGSRASDLGRSFLEHLMFGQGHRPETASKLDHYLALAAAVRDRLMPNWLKTQQLVPNRVEQGIRRLRHNRLVTHRQLSGRITGRAAPRIGPP